MLYLLVLGAFALMALAYVGMVAYMRHRDGFQPSYAGLLVMTITMGCMFAAISLLHRFGLDIQHGKPRDVFWTALGMVWVVLAVQTVYHRRFSGTVLMDVGVAPMFKLRIAVAILMVALAISLAVYPESRTQAFAYLTWGAWFFLISRGRIEVRDRGLMVGVFLAWNRIARCESAANDLVRLKLRKGIQRTVHVKLPPARRDQFIELVNERKSDIAPPE